MFLEKHGALPFTCQLKEGPKSVREEILLRLCRLPVLAFLPLEILLCWKQMVYRDTISTPKYCWVVGNGKRKCLSIHIMPHL